MFSENDFLTVQTNSKRIHEVISSIEIEDGAHVCESGRHCLNALLMY